MTEFRFAFPLAFAALVPVFILLVRWWRGQSRSAPPVMRYSDTRLLGGLPVSLRVQLRRLPDVLRLLAWVLLLVALARPQTGSTQQIIRGQGLDIVLTLDISDSMGESDFNGLTRLQAAKNAMQTFIANRQNDRIGFVVFAENAFYRTPPTLDYSVLRQTIQETPLAGDLGLSRRTAIGMGITSAANMLRRSDAPSKVIILLTDGANIAGNVDPITAARAAATFDIRIYTIGLGTTTDTQIAANALDAETLQQIAAIADGQYFDAFTLDDLQNVYQQIDQLERAPIDRQLDIQWQDQSQYSLLAALGLLLIERILRHTLFQTIP